MTRRKCPAGRQCLGGVGCQREGCQCHTSRGSRVCPCCLHNLGVIDSVRGSELRIRVRQSGRKPGPIEVLRVFEDDVLERLKAHGPKRYARLDSHDVWRSRGRAPAFLEGDGE